MNKAFVREAEEIRDRCAGVPVFEPTLDSWLKPGNSVKPSSSVYFCYRETCQTAYFDAFERTISADEVSASFWPKDRGAPVCLSFGLNWQDIVESDKDDSVIRIWETIKQPESDEAHCTTSFPSGQSCIASIQKCYMQLRSG